MKNTILYNTVFNRTILNSLLLFALSALSFADAALYRGIDAQGNVVYSDTPFEDAEEYTPPPISVVAPLKKKEVSGSAENDEAAAGKEPAEFKYLDFDIVSPINNQTIRNEQDVKVMLKINPGLNTEKEHTIWLLMDKRPVVKKSLSTSLQVEQVDRGAHQLQAEIRDGEGKMVIRTRPVVFFVHK
ncbi:MAG: DUF4124 domain-containing protein [Proteobacteria bacterium]|nr:DUF4124 domain-containing protein [Pseudomonadota bacterium]